MPPRRNKEDQRDRKVTVEESRQGPAALSPERRAEIDQFRREKSSEEFIRQREKSAKALQNQGLSNRSAVRQAGQNLAQTQGIAGVGQGELNINQQAALQEQLQGEATTREQLSSNVLQDAQVEQDRLTNLARAGLIPFRSVANFALKTASLGSIKDDFVTKETTGQIARAPGTKQIFAAVGKATTAGVTVGGVKISAASLFSRRGEISALQSDASEIRETSEATLRSARDSQDYATAIQIYDSLIEANRLKHQNIQDLIREDPNSIEAGVTDATSMNRDLNRLISDRGILQRAQITGDPSELNRAVIALDLQDTESLINQ